MQEIALAKDKATDKQRDILGEYRQKFENQRINYKLGRSSNPH